jgi:hypothetical protein
VKRNAEGAQRERPARHRCGRHGRLDHRRDTLRPRRRVKEHSAMPGLVTFDSLAAAIREGFQVYDRTPTGYVVRKHTFAGWAMALVEVRRVI